MTRGRRPRPPCGTYRGYQWHYRHGQDSCDECREARNAYMAEWRSNRTTALRDLDRLKNSAYESALRRVARLHPDQFTAIYQDELKKRALQHAHGEDPLVDRRRREHRRSPGMI